MPQINPKNPKHIFVFGSNTEGRHGKGAALEARLKYGAKYGQPYGLQGRSYAIITKDLNKGLRSIPLILIELQLIRLSEYAAAHLQFSFFLTKVGTNLAGYSEKEIHSLIKGICFPKNIIQPPWLV